MTDYERGYKDGMAAAALPNIFDNGDKINGYTYSYKTDSEGIPYININCVKTMLRKAANVQPVKRGRWVKCGKLEGKIVMKCSVCEQGITEMFAPKYHYCPNCGAVMQEKIIYSDEVNTNV